MLLLSSRNSPIPPTGDSVASKQTAANQNVAEVSSAHLLFRSPTLPLTYSSAHLRYSSAQLLFRSPTLPLTYSSAHLLFRSPTLPLIYSSAHLQPVKRVKHQVRCWCPQLYSFVTILLALSMAPSLSLPSMHGGIFLGHTSLFFCSVEPHNLKCISPEAAKFIKEEDLPSVEPF